MQIGIESLTARTLAGMIYAEKISSTKVFQVLEEVGAEEKIEEIHELLFEMYECDNHHKAQDR